MYDSIIILGATATGKTGVSIKLAKALNTQVINADSMYIYKDLSIGTAKPTENEMGDIVHHLIGFVDAKENFNVVNFRDCAKQTLEQFKNKNLLPIIVGGTGFYIDSLISNYSYGNDTHSDELRNQLLDELTQFGKAHLYNHLKEIDPQVAEKLHENDTSRIIRAIEIKTLSGESKNSISNNEKPLLANPLIIGLTMPRELLYERINKRVDIMIEDGLIDEVRSLVESGLTPENSQSMKGIGYKEIYDFLIGSCTLDFAIEKIKQHTRNYAKRQITWFKRYDNVHWFDMSQDIDIIDKILKLLNI